MKKWHWLLKLTTGIVIIIAILILINTIPTLRLKTKGMHELEGDWINVFYQTEETAAKDVFALADSKAKEITQKLGFTKKQDVKIYIYDDQRTMQMKKYGYIAPLLSLDWYIGDNIGTNVILTSPAHPGTAHSYDSVKYAVLHEMVHAYVSVLNPKIQLWLTEGAALYLANGEPFSKSYLETFDLPSYSDIHTKKSNPSSQTLADINWLIHILNIWM